MGVTYRQKTKRGPWWVFVKHTFTDPKTGEPKRLRKSKCVGKDKNEAKLIAAEIAAALARGDWALLEEPVPTEPGVTFGVYADRYLKASELALKHSTWVDYTGNVKLHLKPRFGDRPLASITMQDVKDLAIELRSEERGKEKNRRKRAPKGVRKIVGTLSTILSDAVEDGLIPANPALQLSRKGKRVMGGTSARSKVQPLSREELTHLLSTAEAHAIPRKAETTHPYRAHLPFLLTLARTGIRLGEALGAPVG